MAVTMVTGGLGYVGRHIVDRLARQGEGVISFNRDYTEAAAPNVTVVQGELYDIPRIVAVVRQYGIERIIHTAAMSHPDLSIDLPITTVTANIDGTVQLFEAAKLAGVNRIVNFSSETVYGNHENPIDERTPPNPTTPYGATKAATEMFARVYNLLYGTDIVSLRVSEVYGPGNKMPQILRDILKSVLAGRPFRLDSGGAHRFQFVHVEDVARAAIAAADSGARAGDVYNITGGGQWTLNQAVAAIRRLLPQADIVIGPGHWHLDRQGPWDISAAERDLGYKPAYSFEDGLHQYCEWLRTHEY